MGTYGGNFDLPPIPGESEINAQALSKEEQRLKEEERKRNNRIRDLIRAGISRSQVEAQVDAEIEAENLAEARKYSSGNQEEQREAA